MEVFLLALLASYLFGSIPTSYLAARWTRGVDLRRLGSGNVGSSNLRRVVGKYPAALVGLADVFKGALPVFLAERAGWDLTRAGLLGLATICGHNWSLYLGFSGGRGLASTLGVLLITAPWAWILVVGGLAVGTAVRRTALWAAIGLLLVPPTAAALGEPDTLVHLLLALVALAAAKRLVANGEPLPPANWKRVLWNRLAYDRDVGPEEEWTERPQMRDS